MKLKAIIYVVLVFILTFFACSNEVKTTLNENSNFIFESDTIKKKKTMDEWKKQLTDEEFRITRLKGTERAFTGKYWDHKEKGIYACVCCGTDLFKSETKFNSGTGWPSFYDVINKQNVGEVLDKSHGMIRTEVVCKKCDAHLGHMFDDGPKPTGLRYCINSASLNFKKK